MTWWLIGLTIWLVLLTLLTLSVIAAHGRALVQISKDRETAHSRINNLRRYLKLPEYPIDYFSDGTQKDTSTL